MDAVLISIRPKWCELIAKGKKTVELRKSKPKLSPPFKCYIYCTKENNHECLMQNADGVKKIYALNYKTAIPCGGYIANGKVIGEFVCDEIKRVHCIGIEKEAKCAIADGRGDEEYYDNSCVSYKEAYYYLRNVKKAYGWHISKLKLYTTPIELGEFRGVCVEWDKGKFTAKCEKCGNYYVDYRDCCSICLVDGELELTRAPQSWRYVIDVE